MQSILGRAGEQISSFWKDVYDTVLNPKPDAPGDTRIAEEARARAPVIWLLGMVGSGKSSIIRTLTGSSDAEVGTGYRPCTATARIYEFPRRRQSSGSSTRAAWARSPMTRRRTSPCARSRRIWCWSSSGRWGRCRPRCSTR